MAPKRRRVVGSVKKTKKVVKETLEVSFVESGTTNNDADTHRAVVDSQETIELIDSLSPLYPPEERIKRTIIVEETKTPDQELAVDDHNVGEPTPKPPERGKETKQDKGIKLPEGSRAADETQEPKKKVKEGTGKGGDGGGKRLRKRRRRKVEEGIAEYKRYVFRVLKQVHPGMKVSSQAMEVLNAYMNDMFERLADEAAKLSKYTKKMTLSSREIQGAVRLVLPGDLGKHAIAEGAKAVTNYMDYDGNDAGKTKSC